MTNKWQTNIHSKLSNTVSDTNSWPCAQWNSQGVVFDFQTSQQKGPGPCPDRTIIVIIKLKHGGTADSTFVGLQPNILTNATVCQNKSNTTIESRLPTPTWQNNSVENEMLFDHDWKKTTCTLHIFNLNQKNTSRPTSTKPARTKHIQSILKVFHRFPFLIEFMCHATTFTFETLRVAST